MAAGLFFYYAAHPEAAGSLIKNAASRFAGVSIDIEHLSYSFRPLRFAAKEVTIKPVSGVSGFLLKIPELDAHMTLEGPFGSRCLVIDTIHATGFSFTYRQSDFQPIPKGKPSVSFAEPIIMRLVAFLFFKDIRIDEVTLADGEVAAQLNGSTLTAGNINARRSPDKRIEIAADAFFQWPSGKTKIRIPDFHLSLNDALSLSDPTVKGRATANGIRLEHPEIKIADVDLQIDGDFDVSKRQMNAPEFSVSAGDYLKLTGALETRSGAEPEAKVSVREAYFLPEKVLSLLPERFIKGLPPLAVTDKVSVDGMFKIVKKPAGWGWNGDLNLRFLKNPFSYVTGKHRLRGRITGALKVYGEASDAALSGSLTLKQTQFSTPNLSMDLSEIIIPLAGKHPAFRIENASAKISRLKGIPWAKKIPLEDIRLQITEGVFDLKDASCRLSGVRLQSPLIRNVTASITADAKKVRMQIKGKKTGLLKAGRTLNLLPPGWQFNADDSIFIDATLKPADTLSFASRIHFDKLSMQGPDERLLGENIGVEAQIDGKMKLADASVTGTVAFKMTDGEILYDLYYVDLKSNPFSISGQSVYTSSTQSVEFKDLNLTLKNALSMDITGGLKLQPLPKVRLSLNVPPAPIGPLFKLFVADPFQSKKPYLSAFSIDGRVSTDLKLVNTAGGLSVRGRLQWQDGSLSIKEKNLSLSDIRMDAPIWYQAGTGHAAEKVLKGNVAIGLLNMPPMPEQAIVFTVNATPNSLSIPASRMIQIPGGSAQLGPVKIRDIFSGRVSAETKVTVNPTDIAPLLASVWPDMPESLLSGTLDPVIIQGDRIDTGGELIWEGFGGRIILSKLGMGRFLTAGALTRVSAELGGLNLGQITEGTAFGRVDGVLNGSIRGFEIAYGQPQKFDLLFETEKKKGVKQKISIKAVDNIARIGSGQSPFMGFAGTFTSLFETLNYEKIGIRASLENDLFRINGTVMDKGREYLMKGSLFAGVNIINQNPDNRIRFKDMVKRIKRATSEDGKPEIR